MTEPQWRWRVPSTYLLTYYHAISECYRSALEIIIRPIALFVLMIIRIVHPFHLLDGSPWPLLMSFALCSLALSVASWMNHLPTSLLPIALIVLILLLWWRDVLREAKGGYHTIVVQRGILIGFILFLLSEVMLFVSFFWAFFHSSLCPNVELAAVWPPVGIQAVDPWTIPLLGSSV